MKLSLFARRLFRERMCKGQRDPLAPILSTNPKTGVSLNLPVTNCLPTRACSHDCYACQGPISFLYAIEKALAIDRWILDYPEWAADKTAQEAKGRIVRLNGSGDMTPRHLPYVCALRGRRVKVFGFTKRPDTWLAFADSFVQLMFSVDVTMDSQRLEWALKTVPCHRLAYCRRPEDPDWSQRVAVTFPEHGRFTNHKDEVPPSATDCPAVRLHARCEACQRCF